MDLSPLFAVLEEQPAFRVLADRVARDGLHTAVVPPAARAYFLSCLHRRLELPMLVVTSRPEAARELADGLEAWGAQGRQVLLFPERDSLPYERLPSDARTTQQRLRVLALLALWRHGQEAAPLVVASAQALMHPTVSAAELPRWLDELRVGDTVSLTDLLARWQSLGYSLEPKVVLPGTAAHRGGVLDIFPPGTESPVRIELVGDTIESMRFFEPETQRSTGHTDHVTIAPARELLPSGEGSSRWRLPPGLRLEEAPERLVEEVQEDLRRLHRGESFDGEELYASLYNQDSLISHLPSPSLVVTDENDELAAVLAQLEEQAESVRQAQQERGQLWPGFPRPYLPPQKVESVLASVPRRLVLTRWEAGEEATTLGFGSAPSFAGRLRDALSVVQAMLAAGSRVVIVSHQAPRLSEVLQEEGLPTTPRDDLVSVPPPGSLSLLSGSIGQGFLLRDGGGEGAELALLGDAELFGFVKQRRRQSRRAQPVLSSAELQVGDYVVHVEHGIARYRGLVTKSIEGVERDYLHLEYAGGDRLFVPAEQSNRVERYMGPGGPPPALNRLGTQEWSRTKERVRRATEEVARQLLELYARRQVQPGISFSPDTVWQQELEASFPYIETPDQMEAVAAVKRDMETPRPMERLVCGDVGYGKTEVALRAAFKAVMDGFQVAVLVPTTVLAQQHYTTFRERLGPFPLVVEMLSRFRSEKEQREVLRQLQEGRVDICIGTHRLLQKDVVFKNLGLVIVDEEQRFGVVHKEHLKQLRASVDVLTLTATPIPRTLHLSLTGVRDMSTMETPPEERLPIRTYVTGYDDELVRQAILRELDRGGQVFFVHNRVHNIAGVAVRLRQLVPEALIEVAHGQMPEEQLEEVMLRFVAGQTDVLVCTTIIESGLDIPSANTIIINQADKLGLAQLYQLRGRVGRGTNRAYAYLLYDKNRPITEAAQKRLQTMFEATELGAGFRIAMQDLEIRGAGNILGAQQSGHIGAVGFELYSRLLRHAVERLQAEAGAAIVSPPPAPDEPGVKVDLPLAAHLPSTYVAEVSDRLEMYSRLASVSRREELDELAEELHDRYGPLPTTATNLLYVVETKLKAAAAGATSISVEEGALVVRLGEGHRVDTPALARRLGDTVQIRPRSVRLDWRSLGSRWRRVLTETLDTLAEHRLEAQVAG